MIDMDSLPHLLSWMNIQ